MSSADACYRAGVTTKEYKNCQSCGMPLKRDEEGGGSNADGTKSTRFCSHCYVGGAFTQPDITVDQMKVHVRGKMKEMGVPWFITPFVIRGLPKLERWRAAGPASTS